MEILLKDFTRKNGTILHRCRKCDNLLAASRAKGIKVNIMGRHVSLNEKPRAIKTCDCCKVEAQTYAEMTDKFRRFRNNKKPSSFTLICKKCENTATMILSEFKYYYRQGLTLSRGSTEYTQLLKDLYEITGFTTIPLDAYGQPVDLMKYKVNFCMLDGRKFTTSAVSIRQIKINAGYMPSSENRSNECQI